jgi:hypothetical protein
VRLSCLLGIIIIQLIIKGGGYMESDISDISDIINDTTIKKRRKLLWVTTKIMRFLRNFTEKSTY